MAVDTFAKRMAVSGVPLATLGPGVFPGTTGTPQGRGAAAWNYTPVAFAPPAVTGREKFTLGTKESMDVTVDPTLGGRWSW